ncbi:MAG: hypothetical protein HQ546_12155, partial [Planctomycetes bacterium]|nr:hypothetical protein [Planctomycetota bacterium]
MPEQTTQPNKKSLPLKSLLILAVIMLLEGGLFALWMNLAGPENAAAKGIGEQLPQSAADSTAELQILQFSAPWQK